MSVRRVSTPEMSACGQVLVRFLSSNGVSFLVVAVTAFVSVLLALPTFSEIPLALGLLAGPAVHLPLFAHPRKVD
jgi:hypothetical protein